MARSPGSQHCVGGFDFSDFAQEFLRRNPDYRFRFAEAARIGRGALRSPANRRMAHPWGIEFPCRSLAFSQRGPRDLARRRQSERPRDCRSGPGPLAASSTDRLEPRSCRT